MSYEPDRGFQFGMKRTYCKILFKYSTENTSFANWTQILFTLQL